MKVCNLVVILNQPVLSEEFPLLSELFGIPWELSKKVKCMMVKKAQRFFLLDNQVEVDEII